MEILRASHLCKTYGKGENEVRALDDVSFSIEKGEFVAIVGTSGSGKSTLMHILGGVDRPDSGSVYMDGQDIYKQNDEQLAIFRRRQVGLIYQFYNLIPVLDAVENMTLPALLDGRKVEKSRINQMINDLGLKGREHHLPNQLSGGQQQRVAIARAMVKKPDILLCDELTGALDTKSSKDVLQRVQKMNDTYKTTVVIITHNLNIAGMADRIIKITDGKVVSNQKNVDKKRVEEMELKYDDQ